MPNMPVSIPAIPSKSHIALAALYVAQAAFMAAWSAVLEALDEDPIDLKSSERPADWTANFQKMRQIERNFHAIEHALKFKRR